MKPLPHPRAPTLPSTLVHMFVRVFPWSETPYPLGIPWQMWCPVGRVGLRRLPLHIWRGTAAAGADGRGPLLQPRGVPALGRGPCRLLQPGHGHVPTCMDGPAVHDGPRGLAVRCVAWGERVARRAQIVCRSFCIRFFFLASKTTSTLAAGHNNPLPPLPCLFLRGSSRAMA